MKEYTIVRDNYNGYEVQVNRTWLPFWIEVGSKEDIELGIDKYM